MTDAGSITRSLLDLRDAGRTTLLVRLVVLGGCLLSLVALTGAPWDAPDAAVVVGAVLAAGCVGLPDSPIPLLFSLTMIGAVAMRSDGDIDASVVALALALLAVHVGCSLGAATALPTQVDAEVVRRWARPTAVLAVATLAAAGVLAALSAWGPAGALGVTVAALLLLGALAVGWTSEA